MPKNILPKTANISPAGGKRLARRDSTNLPEESNSWPRFGFFGAYCGFNIEMTTMYSMYKAARMRPGTRAAIKRSGTLITI